MYTYYIVILSFWVWSVRAEGSYKLEQNIAAIIGSGIMLVLFVNCSTYVLLRIEVHCVPLIAIDLYCYSTKYSILIQI